jgi:3-methyladenine DNA glycosylase Mpg
MPLSFFAIVDSVMTRPYPVRCGKSRRVVGSDASGRLRCCTGPARLSKALNVKVSADQTEYDDSRLTA